MFIGFPWMSDIARAFPVHGMNEWACAASGTVSPFAEGVERTDVQEDSALKPRQG